MLEYEKMKRNSILPALDEPLDITYIMSDVIRNLKNENIFDKELNLKILGYIKYLLENGLFEVGDDYYVFEKWNLNLEDTLLKIKTMLESGESLVMRFYFNLTDKGQREALNYSDKGFEIQEKVLLSCQNNPIELDKIAKFVEEVFSTNDPEEIEYELLDCIVSLVDWHFIEIIYFVDNQCHTLSYSVYPDPNQFKDKVKSYIISKEKLETKNQMLCRIAPDGQLVLDEWKKSGGRISDHYNKIVFTKEKDS